MNQFNIALFIKRAEIFHTEEYIRKVFQNQQYGDVDEIKFIKKYNFLTGQEYNGAIVTFHAWYNSDNVDYLFDQMVSTPDGTAKIFHDNLGRKYWVVCQHKSPVTSGNIQNVSSELPDHLRIASLEDQVASLTSQLQFFQAQHEKNEKKFMELEYKEIHSQLVTAELKSQLADKEQEMGKQILFYNDLLRGQVDDFARKVTDMEQELKKRNTENELLRTELEEKKLECAQLADQLYEESNILMYVHQQANEMRNMLHIEESFPLKGKMTVEELKD
jgi:hypothetical protein